eukprot:3268499-Amphidinium_carterae.2
MPQAAAHVEIATAFQKPALGQWTIDTIVKCAGCTIAIVPLCDRLRQIVCRRDVTLRDWGAVDTCQSN